MSDNKCRRCESEIAFSNGVITEIEGQRVLLCPVCWNKNILEDTDVDFEDFHIKPITLKDCDGADHTFHIQTLIFGDHVTVHAKELLDNKDIGYMFCVSEKFNEGNHSDLLLAIYEKIKGGLSRKYVIKSDDKQNLIKDQTVFGRIAWDQNYQGERPELWIDGKRFTLDELGKMMMVFEGWQFKLEMLDPSDDVL